MLRIRDPKSGSFLNPLIRDPGWVKQIRIWIRDPDPGWTTWIIFPIAWKQFFGLTLKFFDADPGWNIFGSGMFFPGSETLAIGCHHEYVYLVHYLYIVNYLLTTPSAPPPATASSSSLSFSAFTLVWRYVNIYDAHFSFNFTKEHVKNGRFPVRVHW